MVFVVRDIGSGRGRGFDWEYNRSYSQAAVLSGYRDGSPGFRSKRRIQEDEAVTRRPLTPPRSGGGGR